MERVVPLEVLEREITALASQIHAATCRWLALVAEYDRREGWAQWGCKSCAHWVSQQCGIALGPAREHVRVARQLEALPLTSASFEAGELSYSKVRALTRIGNVERESELVELALHATASQLERVVRAYRGVVAAERVAAGGPPERWVLVDRADDGSLLLRARLPAEEGALVLAALDAAQDALTAADLSKAGAGVPARTSSDGGPSEAAADGPMGASSKVGAFEPAAKGPIGASSNAGRADEPAADGSAGTPAISAGEARADALLALADGYLAGGRGTRTGGDRYQVLVHVDPAALAGDPAAERCELDHGARLAVNTARRLACDAGLVHLSERDGTPLDVGRKTRSIPPALRRALTARDGGCRFPGCTSRRFVDAHHIEHWAAGGATRLRNLVQLCRHHHRLLHEGGYMLAEEVGELVFRRPDGRRVPACPPRPGRPGPLRATRQPDACVPRSGDRLHLADGVEALLTFAPIATGEPPGI
jgi:hypothetical protein